MATENVTNAFAQYLDSLKVEVKEYGNDDPVPGPREVKQSFPEPMPHLGIGCEGIARKIITHFKEKRLFEKGYLTYLYLPGARLYCFSTDTIITWRTFASRWWIENTYQTHRQMGHQVLAIHRGLLGNGTLFYRGAPIPELSFVAPTLEGAIGETNRTAILMKKTYQLAVFDHWEERYPTRLVGSERISSPRFPDEARMYIVDAIEAVLPRRKGVQRYIMNTPRSFFCADSYRKVERRTFLLAMRLGKVELVVLKECAAEESGEGRIDDQINGIFDSLKTQLVHRGLKPNCEVVDAIMDNHRCQLTHLLTAKEDA